jgi:hypothetical protein
LGVCEFDLDVLLFNTWKFAVKLVAIRKLFDVELWSKSSRRRNRGWKDVEGSWLMNDLGKRDILRGVGLKSS